MWLWLWTFARGGERSKSGVVGASTLRSGSPPATTAPLAAAAAAVAAAPTSVAALLYCSVGLVVHVP